MFCLASLECYGCRYFGSPNTFYDSNIKRACFCKCSHALCKQCIEKFVNCPVCDTKIEEVRNFAAQNLLDAYREDPVKVFKRWWNNEGDQEETCIKCCKPCNYLRICLTCYSKKMDSIIVYGDSDKERPWEKNEKRMKRRRQIEKFQMKCIYTDIDPDEEIDNIDLKIYFHCDFNLFANLACCAECILTHHPGHLVNSIEELTPIIDFLKQSAAMIAGRFLIADVEKYVINCKLRKLRLQRICEKLTHYVSSYFRSADGVLRNPDIHFSRRSKLNKFFDLMPWENLDNITRKDVDQMINYLETEIKGLDHQEDCNCSAISDEMHNLGFGNQVEQKFVEVIEELEYRIVRKCPFPEEEFQNMRDKAEKLSKSKLHLIYTVFCWNLEKKDVCCLFDSSNHKPCICPNCNKPSCLECLKSGESTKCPFCIMKYDMIPVDYVPVIDEKVLELVKFYKENCLELLQNWWKADTSMLGFCLKCSSYTEQLEICVFCELDHKKPVLKATQNSIDPKFHLSKNLSTFPIRWQCADCKQRLIEKWVHRKTEDSEKGGWRRGCVHANSYCSLRNTGNEHCGLNAKALEDILESELAIRLATMNLVFLIVKAEIEEKIECQWRKIQFVKAVGMLKTKIRRFLLNREKKGRESESESLEIKNSINKLKVDWNDCLAECSCSGLWETVTNGLSRRKIRKILSSSEQGSQIKMDYLKILAGMSDEIFHDDIDISLLNL